MAHTADMTSLLLFIVVLFVAIGVTTGIYMGRRGYNAWAWGVVGTVLGPLVVPLLAFAARDRSGQEIVMDVAEAAPAASGVRVLVGVDGSAESFAALHAAVATFGSRLGRLTLATVVDFDAMEALRVPGERHDVIERRARELLDGAATAAGVPCDTVILAGRPDEALLDYIERHAIDVVAIGARGSGLAKAVLGSVADRLVGAPNALVLVSGPASHVRSELETVTS
jgi:nucleotide-binding universal stress UspA family protein